MTVTAIINLEATTFERNTQDVLDEVAAGRPYPRRPLKMHRHAEVSAWLRVVRLWWLDVAAGYLAEAERGEGAAIDDAKRAFAESERYNPKAGV